MALRFVPELSKSLEGGRRATVVLESSGVEELLSSAARQMAVEEAGKLGCSGGGVSKSGGTYPIDENGNTNDDVMLGRVKVAAYRIDYDVRTVR